MKQPRHAVKYTLAVLLLAALTTTEILSATYAKYIISSGLVADSARVAVYDVTVSGSADDVNLDAAGSTNISGGNIENQKATVTKAYAVVNNSEVAVSYRIEVTLPGGNLPTGTSMEVTGADCRTEGNTFIYTSSAWVLPPKTSDSAPQNTINLVFTTNNTNNAAVTDLTGIGVTVKVVATQID